MKENNFDAIVIGAGMSGGWAAKERDVCLRNSMSTTCAQKLLKRLGVSLRDKRGDPRRKLAGE